MDKQKIKRLKNKIQKITQQRDKAIQELVEYKQGYEEKIKVIKKIEAAVKNSHYDRPEITPKLLKWWIQRLDMRIYQDKIDRGEA